MSISGIGGSNAATAVISQSQTPDSKPVETPTTPAEPAAPQDPKGKMGEMQLEGKMREASLRTQFETKMPDIKPSLEDKEFLESKEDALKTPEGFKAFDKPAPSTDLQWPVNGNWQENKSGDGSIRRTLKDDAGNQWNETIDKQGSRERERIGADGMRQFELIQPSGYKMQGGADKDGTSITTDSNGVTTRFHSDPSGKAFS